MRHNIPVTGKKFDNAEIKGIINAALDGWWTEGKVAKQFEEKFNTFLGTTHTIITNSGSSANLIALRALTSKKIDPKRRLKPNDEVITVAAGFPTTINPILECRCIPVFCDIDIGSYNININNIVDVINTKTKAIVLAHTLGNPFNLDLILRLCEEYNLYLIEDTCDALGSKYRGWYVGTFGDLGTFSYYPAHIINMAEGGSVVTNNDELAKIVRSIRDWGRDCWCPTGKNDTCGHRFDHQFGNLPFGYDHKFVYSEIGYNLKNTDLNIAIGVAQMDKLPEFMKDRERNFNYLYKALAQFNDIFYLPQWLPESEPCWFGFPLTLKPDVKFTRRDLQVYLSQHSIDSRLLFAGNITKQPYFVDYDIKYCQCGNLENTDYVMENTFWIGVCPLITPEDLEYMVTTITEFVENEK